MNVVGERGVSTGVAPPSRAGHTSSTSGLDGSSLTWTNGISLQQETVGHGLLVTLTHLDDVTYRNIPGARVFIQTNVCSEICQEDVATLRRKQQKLCQNSIKYS